MTTSKIPNLLLGVLWSALGTVSGMIAWYPTSVNDTTLAAAKSTVVSDIQDLTCAIKATQTPWCEVFCFEGSRCSLYNVTVAGYHDDSAVAPATPCYTRNSCVFNGIGYQHDEDFVGDCTPMKCWEQTAISTSPPGPPSCVAPFTAVPNVGCVYYHNLTMTWCDARLYCKDLGADLPVPTNVTALNVWATSYGERMEVWIGIRSRTWLDGTPVTEWGARQPDGAADECGMTTYLYVDGVDDRSCGYLSGFVCELNF
ncbi:uncharacterized protein LOC125040829 [Penaeus chinensis]|uniref:uncharacterized protein LOC125040829 n=1 Tax=Penaeus chinensis TaxID=139456 RepID=UPI001FB5EF4C|nr:uncharacterized protein LOC125040829 [Penaeus chinensis]